MIGNRRYRNKIIGEQRYGHNLEFIRLVDVTVFDWDEYESGTIKARLLMQRAYRELWIKGEKEGEKIPLLWCSAKRLTDTLHKVYDLAVSQNKKYEENLRVNYPLDYLTLLNTKENVDEGLLESAEERVAIVLSDLPESRLSELSEIHSREMLGALYVEELFRTT